MDLGTQDTATTRFNRNAAVRIFALSLLASLSLAQLSAAPSIPIELPNEHPFLKVRDVDIVEKEGKTALNGSVFKIRNKFMPWGSHLHIDLIDIQTNEEGEEVEVLIECVTYRFRRNDFDDGNKFKRFFTYVDLSNPDIDKIEIESFTQQHSDICGEEEGNEQAP